MNIDDIHCVFVVGAGTMGQQIALQCAMHGFDVILYDVKPEGLKAAEAKIQTYAADLVGRRRLTDDESKAALARISFTSDPEEAAKADLLSESVPEDPRLKAKVFAQFSKICPPHTILTTNTSTLVPSMYAEATGRPGQFAALHFYQYVWDQNLVDVMPHPGTSPETTKLLYAFAKRIGGIPLVLKKENPEYVVNAILGAIDHAVLKLLFDGVASVEDIDRAFMIVMGTPIGPLGSLDVVGLDVVWHIMQNKAEEDGDPLAKAVGARFKKEYIDNRVVGPQERQGVLYLSRSGLCPTRFLDGWGQPLRQLASLPFAVCHYLDRRRFGG